jgi:hypothetical protein
MQSTCCPPKTFTIFQGDSKTMNLGAIYDTLIPLDLTECTQINVMLPNADGSTASLLLTEDEVSITSPSVLGQFTVPITTEVSSLLNPGELQTFDVTFTINSDIFTVRYSQALSVFEAN